MKRLKTRAFGEMFGEFVSGTSREERHDGVDGVEVEGKQGEELCHMRWRGRVLKETGTRDFRERGERMFIEDAPQEGDGEVFLRGRVSVLTQKGGQHGRGRVRRVGGDERRGDEEDVGRHEWEYSRNAESLTEAQGHGEKCRINNAECRNEIFNQSFSAPPCLCEKKF